MKTLFLVRHSKSEKDIPGLKDIDRPLNRQGYESAYLMSRMLKEKNNSPSLIISSPAVRAISTAFIFARTFNYSPSCVMVDPSIYNSEVDTMIEILDQVNNKHDSVMLFGHNPTFTYLANDLCEKAEINHFPTTGIVCLTFDIDNWKKANKHEGKLVFFDFPKNHS